MTVAGATPDPNAREVRIGLAAGLAAYGLWGVLPLFLKTIGYIPAAEILAHRILWSIPFGALVLTLRSQWPMVRAALADRRLLFGLALTAFCISGNWFFYVWAVGTDRVMEASLGYYINPLLNVVAGVLLLGERLTRMQTIAIGLAAVGVLVLAVGTGAPPWIALLLGVLFCVYGFLRKKLEVNAMPGLFIETSWLVPFAAAYLAYLSATGAGAAFARGPDAIAHAALLGPVTVGPLVFFAVAARRLKLSTVGVLQYVAPTMQFGLAIAFGEPFGWPHAICFALIWTALGLFSWEALKAHRAQGAAAAPAQAASIAARGREAMHSGKTD